MDISLWIQITLGGLVGAALGALITWRALAWQVRTEMTVKIADDYSDNYDLRNHVKFLLNPKNFPGKCSPKDIKGRNQIRKVGDWYELVAILHENRLVNTHVFNSLGLDRQMCKFAHAVKCYNILEPNASWKSLMTLEEKKRGDKMKDSEFDETIQASEDTGSGSSKEPIPVSNGEAESGSPDQVVKCPHCNREIKIYLEVDSEAQPIPVSNGEAESGSPDQVVKCPHCNREIKIYLKK